MGTETVIYSECITSARWSCLAGVGLIRPDLRDDGIHVLCYARSAGLRHRWAAYRTALHAMGTGLACTGLTLTRTLILILTLTPLSLYISIAIQCNWMRHSFCTNRLLWAVVSRPTVGHPQQLSWATCLFRGLKPNAYIAVANIVPTLVRFKLCIVVYVHFYQRVSIASYASAGIARGGMSVCPSVCPSVRLSVRHNPVLYQNKES